jgi:DNA-binding CsgD family transcriptional regulator
MQHASFSKDPALGSVPPFERAYFDLQKAEAASLADTLDGISAGLFLIDAAGRIVHANTAGKMTLKQADILRAAGGRLVTNDRQANRTLADAFATAGNGKTACSAIPLVARDGNCHVAHVLPLTSGPRRKAGADYAAAAALFIHTTTLDTRSPAKAIAKAYKLTPMELRVLLTVVEVGGKPGVAKALGIAETTVKTHLDRLFQKTGVGRQADLVKIVAGFVNPLIK